MLLDSPSEDQPVASEDPALVYAQFAHGLLDVVDKRATQEDISETYRGRLKQLGFCRGENVSREATIQALEAHYGAAEIENMDIAYRTGQRSQWLRHVSRKISTQEVPISRHLLLAAFLFRSAIDFVGSLSEAQERLKLRSPVTPGVHKKMQSAITNQTTDPHTAKYLSTLSAAIVENPDCTIEMLWVRFPGTLKRLLKRDSVAFEIFREGLQSKTRAPQRVSPRAEARDARDEANAELLRQAATRLYASNSRPVRISRKEILRTAGLRPGDGHAKWFPASAQVLNEYVDSAWHFWARRYVWSLVQLGETAGSSELRAHSGLLSYNFRELVPFFSKLNVPKVLKTGQLTAVLAQYGIDRSWDGPCPDREVKKAGRAYQRATGVADMPANRKPKSGKHWVKKGAAELEWPFTPPARRSARSGN